ncbi:MAG: ribbon-helix-helix domain-containing protein [Candidatus Woesearchaeota archaeon]
MVKFNHYKNIALPSDLIERIDIIIQSSKLGYKTRGEFVKEAVRNLLKDLNNHENNYKNNSH